MRRIKFATLYLILISKLSSNSSLEFDSKIKSTLHTNFVDRLTIIAVWQYDEQPDRCWQ